jgi:uncharacterized membrane protein
VTTGGTSSLRARRFRRRLLGFTLAALGGFLFSALAPNWIRGATRLVAAYDAGAVVLLVFFFAQFHRDPKRTRERAAFEDPGRNVILLVVLAAVVLGLVSAVAIIGHGPKVHNPAEKWLAYGFGVLAVVLGWILVHTVYTLRYAHLYWYGEDTGGAQCGGILFPGTDEPCDIDFAYFAFSIGTSFAVSDPQVTETRVRGEIIAHSIISFAYNSVIIGMVINLIAGIFASSGT